MGFKQRLILLELNWVYQVHRLIPFYFLDSEENTIRVLQATDVARAAATPNPPDPIRSHSPQN